jgi:hypothetical protein
MRFHIDKLTARSLLTVFVVSLVWHSGDKLVEFLTPGETVIHGPARVAENKSKATGREYGYNPGALPEGTYGVRPSGTYGVGFDASDPYKSVFDPSDPYKPKGVAPAAPKKKRANHSGGYLGYADTDGANLGYGFSPDKLGYGFSPDKS